MFLFFGYYKKGIFRCLLTGWVVLFFINNEVAGQAFRENLQWNMPDSVNYEVKGEAANIDEVVLFNGCIFDFAYGKLPLYYKTFKLYKPGSISVKLADAAFVELKESEVLAISDDTAFIKNDIFIEADVRWQKKQPYAGIKILPFRKNNITGKIEKLVDFTIIPDVADMQVATKNKKKNYAASSVLAGGKWYKLAVAGTGLYKVTYNELSAAGLSLPVESSEIRLFGNGGAMLPEKNDEFTYDDLAENAIWVEDGGDGNFDPGDYFIFYGQGTTSWKYDTISKVFVHTNHLYSDINYYFLTLDQGDGKRVAAVSSSVLPATDIVNSFIDYGVHDNDSLNLIKSGKTWYGEKFDILTSYSFSFNFPNIIPGSKAFICADVAASSPYTSSFIFNANGNPLTIAVSPVSSGYNSDYAKAARDTMSFIPGSSPVNVGITYNKPVSSSTGWLNYIEINVERQLALSGGQIGFRNIESVGAGRVSEFNISNSNSSVKVWDVTDPVNAKSINGTLSGTDFVFKSSSDTLKEYVAFDGSSFKSVSFVSEISNQNLHGLGNYDMIIITHPDFVSEALRLADYHTVKSGLSVLVVFPQSIYNEFSSGKQDISAIRNFMKMFYDRADSSYEMPKYLLLFGDGSYDPKSRISDNTNFIPSFQSQNSLQTVASYVSDDFFGLLDDGEGYECNGDLDIGIGRFPVKTMEEAAEVVDKIIRYTDNSTEVSTGNGCGAFSGSIPAFGDWRNIICLIADDEDNNLHFSQAETLASIIENENKIINIDKIYLDAYQQQSYSGGQRYPEVNEAINNRVERGALIINYTGHGGEVGWAHERILELSDINKWSNKNNMPVFVTATCEFSRYDDPGRTSAGEQVLLNKDGGAIALFSTTRLAFSNSNFNLNKSFYYNVFDKDSLGNALKMGDVIRLSKVANNSNVNIRNFVLLGDPALSIAFPRFNVVTTSVPDTMKALSNVTITGFIADNNGDKLSNFNGLIWPTVYDKASAASTLGNDDASYVSSFTVRRNIIYKGKASVVNGDFSFSFVVPKDIAYQYGPGRISYYAEDGNIDAAGYFGNFIIGGADLTAPVDNSGPDIEIFLNDTLFVFGGLTDQNPLLLAFVNDGNGINTVGNGIGHDIVAVLDENTEKSYVLNDYYEADLNTYKSGVVRFPFSDLSEGRHTLSVKVWDVYNNSSEAYTEFVVSTENGLVIERVINYPNPFSDYTSFVFEHNQPCCGLDVSIEVYSITGQLIRTINQEVETDGYRTSPIIWNGMGDDGMLAGKGFYIYKLIVKDNDGNTQQKTGKLVLMR